MAITYKSSIELGGLSIFNGAIHPVAGAPTGLSAGQAYFDTTTGVNRLYLFDGTNWIDSTGDFYMAASTTTVDVAVANRILELSVNTGLGMTTDTNGITMQGADTLTAGTVPVWVDKLGVKGLANSSITDDGTNATATGNFTVVGDLTVQGSMTALETTNTEITDNVVVLNKGEAGAGVSSGTSGIEIDRGTESNVSFVFNETGDIWELGGKLKIGTIATASSVATILVEDGPANAGEVKRVPIGTLKTLLGVQNMSLILEPSSGVQPVGELWVTKSNNVYTVEHYLGTKRIIAQVMDATTGETVMVDVTRTSDDEIDVAFADTVTDGAYILNLQVITAVSHGDGGGAAGGTA